MSKLIQKTKNFIAPNSFISKTITVLFILCFFYAASTLSQAYQYTFDQQPEAYIDLHNAGRAFSIALLILLAALTFIHRDFYVWFSKDKKVKLDERQVSIHRRIMERSYNLTLIILFIFLSQIIVHKAAIIQSLQINSSNDWAWIPFNVLLLISALPLLIASWREDLYLSNPKIKGPLEKINLKKAYLIAFSTFVGLFVLSWAITELSNQLNITISQGILGSLSIELLMVMAFLTIPLIVVVHIIKWTLGRK